MWCQTLLPCPLRMLIATLYRKGRAPDYKTLCSHYYTYYTKSFYSYLWYLTVDRDEKELTRTLSSTVYLPACSSVGIETPSIRPRGFEELAFRRGPSEFLTIIPPASSSRFKNHFFGRVISRTVLQILVTAHMETHMCIAY